MALPIRQCAQNFPARDLVLTLVVALIVAFIWGITARSSVPDVFDSREYAWAAWHLAHDGVFSEEGGLNPVSPGIGREPGYPAFLALMLKFVPGLKDVSPSCLSRPEGCGVSAWRPGLFANGIFIGAAGLAVFISTFWLSGSRLAAWISGGHIWLNAQAASSRGYLLSDYLALLLVAGASLTLIWSINKGSWRWIVTGISFAALTLTKAVFLWLVLPSAVIVLAVILARRHRTARRLSALALFMVGFLPPVGGWMARNMDVGNVFTLTAGRTAIALSTREVFNHMTPMQYAAAFVYWTRGFGDDLAKEKFAEKDWGPFELYRPGGFYMVGQHRLDEEAVRLMESGKTRSEADKQLSGRMMEMILDRPIAYLLSTIPLIWRGIWIDEFIVLSLPALVWLMVAAVRDRRLNILIPLLPGVFSLVFYAAVSLNIPRYQITALPALAIAMGIAVSACVTTWRRRRTGAVPPSS